MSTWDLNTAWFGIYLTIPFVIAIMGTSGTLLYDTLRGISIRHKSLGYYFVTISTSFAIGLVLMLVAQAMLPRLLVIHA